MMKFFKFLPDAFHFHYSLFFLLVLLFIIIFGTIPSSFTITNFMLEKEVQTSTGQVQKAFQKS